MKFRIGDKTHKIVASHGFLVFALIATGALTWGLRGADIGALLAAATSSLGIGSTTLYMSPYEANELEVGDTAQIDVNVNASVPINAVGVTIAFPKDSLEVVGINKRKSFLDLWTEETTIREEAGEVSFSGGTFRQGGLIGTGTVLTLLVKAKRSGESTLQFTNTEILGSDGHGSHIAHEKRSLTFSVRGEEVAAPAQGSSSSQEEKKEPDVLSADFNGSGSVTLIDMSILTVRMFAPYDTRFDLNRDGSIGLGDLSVLFSQM